MPLQIINENPIGAGVGKAFGEGISDALSAITQNKLQQMFQKQEKERQQKILAPIIGEEQARLAVEYPQFLQNPDLVFRFGSQQNQPQQSQNFLPQSLQQAQPQQQQNQLQDILQQLQSPGGAAQLLALTNLGLEQQQPIQNTPIAQQQIQQAIQPEQQQKIPAQPQPEGQIIKGALAKRSPEAEERMQASIAAKNTPFINDVRTSFNNARDIFRTASELKELLKTGEVASGILGARAEIPFVGPSTLGTTSQKAHAKATELAVSLASQQGVPTQFKIRTAKETKPSLSQTPQAQLDITNDILKRSRNAMLPEQIKDIIIEQNNGFQPRDLEPKTHKLVNQYEKFLDKLDRSPRPDGVQAVDDSTGFKAVVQNGIWIPVIG